MITWLLFADAGLATADTASLRALCPGAARSGRAAVMIFADKSDASRTWKKG
jgi:hypothetical protein